MANITIAKEVYDALNQQRLENIQLRKQLGEIEQIQAENRELRARLAAVRTVEPETPKVIQKPQEKRSSKTITIE